MNYGRHVALMPKKCAKCGKAFEDGITIRLWQSMEKGMVNGVYVLPGDWLGAHPACLE